MYQHTFIYLFYFLISKEIKKKKKIYSKPSPTITRSYYLHVVVSVFRLSNAHLVHFVAMRSIALSSEWKFPDVVNSNKTTKMSETQSVDTHDTSNDASDDPLLDLTGDQLFQLVEDTLYVKFSLETNNHSSSKSIYSHLHTWKGRGRQHSFMESDHEIFSTVILPLPLIQEGQLSGERMCTILVNRLED